MTNPTHKIYFNWSSGKDASFALYQMQQEKSFDIDLLVTTINSHLDRVTMQGLRRELLVEQAESIGIKL
ncbi:MAG: diphthamide synthase (EF-2-diphthine--ammonia ligase) [Flavobacteriales bacterium]|jgi:diphthamide synthase (EF-2-diphthine--ammonia ligase)